MRRHLLMSTAIARMIAPIAFMSVDTTDTVIINTDNGPVRINKADYNEKDHTLHELNGTSIPTPDQSGPQPVPPLNGPPANVEPAHNTTPQGGASAVGIQANTPAAPTVVEPMITDPEIVARISAMNFAVITTGKGKAARYFIVNTLDDGKPVEGVPGIDKDGYTDNKAAWDALYRVQLSIPRNPPGT